MDAEAVVTPLRILRIKDVEVMTGLKKSSVYERIRNGGFPKPVKLGPRATGFVESEVAEWVNQRLRCRK